MRERKVLGSGSAKGAPVPARLVFAAASFAASAAIVLAAAGSLGSDTLVAKKGQGKERQEEKAKAAGRGLYDPEIYDPGIFDPKRVDAGRLANDEELARALPAFDLRLTGMLDGEVVASVQDILLNRQRDVETRRVRGTRPDGGALDAEYTGIQLRKLLPPSSDAPSGWGEWKPASVVVLGNDRVFSAIPARAVLEGNVYLVWKRDGKYLAAGEEGVLKIVYDGGSTNDWVKNPLLLDFVAKFRDEVPGADRASASDRRFIDQKSLFTLAIGRTPSVRAEEWSLKVAGLVGKPLAIRYGELAGLPRSSVYATLETISNPPKGNLKGNAVWTGVPMEYIFELAKPAKGVVEAIFRCADGYTTSLTVGELRKGGVMLAYLVNGEPLLPQHGYPVRLVLPEKYGMKWAKWVTEVEFIDYDYRGYWESRGWSDYAGRDRPDERHE